MIHELRGLVCLGTMLLLPMAIRAQDAAPDYRNPRLPIEQRVADLLARMTLEEKCAELYPAFTHQFIDPTGQFTNEAAQKALRQMYDDAAHMDSHDGAVLRNAAQRYLVEKTRLGIPEIFMGEALHGFMSYGATSFPQALALASTWDPAQVKKVFTAAADEMASAGVEQAFTPVLDLARDPRWGRTEETYGEDPYLGAHIGVAAIEGMQGPNYLIDRHHVIATAKHFAAHGQPEGGTNTAPANYSERVLRESFLVAFRAAIEEAHAGSVMASYNEIDGIPAHVNTWLLDNVLRQEWGFKGYITSDGGGLQMLVETHHIAADYVDAARQALAAGVDYDLSNGAVYRKLLAQVKAGKVPVWQIDRAVSNVLYTKFRLGLFENPYVDPDYARKITNSPEHRQLAERTAEEAIVLLKNNDNLLPLDLTKLKTIAVIGPNAADVHLGGYSREPAHGVSILDGIRERVGTAAKVVYAEGSRITEGKQGWSAWYDKPVVLPDEKSQLQRIQEAIAVAKSADVAIVVVGENERTNREAWSEDHLGDRDSLDLIGYQDQLIKAIVETGKPTIVFLINGRPLSINYAVEHVPAILEGWYLGQEGGTAAARVLFGDVNPGGKLPISFPRNVGELPDYYNHKPSLNRGYLFNGRKVLFPFGWGLSYTTFKFDNVRAEPSEIGVAGDTTVSVDVNNTGSRAGDEVAQLYIHQKVASVTQPVMQLRGFRRISLKPGEKTTVQFKLTPKELEMLNRDMHWVVEPGTFDIMVGPSSSQTTSIPLQVVAK
ncbi:MAG: glycoside hydrolase family 3 N-terminal domain-containing protein [Bryobacteraceae bacterium]